MQSGFSPVCSQTIFLICSIRFLLHISTGPSGQCLFCCSLCFNIQLILSHAHLMPVSGSMPWFRPFPRFGMLFSISSHKESCTSFRRQHNCYLLEEIFLDPFPYTGLGALLWSSRYACDRAHSWFIWHFQKAWHSGFRL